MKFTNKPYLHDRKFVVYTDHSSLRWLMNVEDATGRLARWALLLQKYNFDIIHRPGNQNGNADALSRRPHPNTILNALQQSDPEIGEIREKQRKDSELSEIIDYIQHDILSSNYSKAGRILPRSDSFYISQDGLLYHLDRSQKLVLSTLASSVDEVRNSVQCTLLCRRCPFWSAQNVSKVETTILVA